MKQSLALTLLFLVAATPLFAHHQTRCHADKLIAAADEFELYSIETSEDFSINESLGKTFHHFPILGKLKITKGADRDSLVRSLSDAIESGSGGANCFSPRHGVRLIVEGRLYDFVICFQCYTLYEYNDKGQNRGTCYTGIDSGAAAVFNKVLGKAGIAIAP